MKKILWGILILVSLVVSGCGAGGKVNDPATDPVTEAGSGGVVVIDPNASVADKVTITIAAVTLVAEGSNPADSASSQAKITAAVTNTAGALVPNQQVFFYSNGGGTFSPSNAVTDSDGNGVVEVIYTAPKTLGPVTIYALSGISKSNDLSTTIVTGPPALIRVSPKKTQAGLNESIEVDIFAYDGNSYPVINKPLTVTVDPNSSGSNGSVPGAPQYIDAPLTDSLGKATVTYVAGSTVGVDTIKVDSGISGVVGTAQVTVSQAATSIKSFTLTPSKTQLLANGTDFSKLTVAVKDTLDAGVAGVAVTFSTDNGSLDLDSTKDAAPLQEQTVTTLANGEAVVYLFSVNAVSTARVNVSGAAYSTTQDFSFIVGTPDKVVLTASPDALGPKLTSALTATVTDKAGNVVPGTLVSFNVTTNVTGSSLPVVSTATTDTFGRATINYTAGTVVGTDTITASTSNNKLGTKTITSSLANVTVATVAATAAKSTLTADSSDSVAVEVKVLDINGKPAVGKSVSFAETLRSGAVAGTLKPATTVTADINGVARVTYVSGKKSGDVQLDATCDGVGSSVSFVLVAGVPAKLYASWDGILDGTGTTNVAVLPSQSNVKIFAKLLDANDNPVIGSTGVTFTFSSAGNQSGGSFVSFLSTDAYGEISSYYFVGSKGNVTDTINVIASNGLSKTLTAAVGQNPASKVELPVVPTSIVASGSEVGDPNSSSTVTALVTDTYGNILVGETVSFYAAGGGIFKNSTGGTTAITDASGQATITFTAPKILGKVKVYAVAGGKTSAQSEISITNGVASKLAVYPAATNLAPSGSTKVLILATDGNGYPVPNTNLFAEVKPNNTGVLIPVFIPSPVTDANGKAEVTYVAGSTSGIDTILVTYGTALSGSADITVTQAAITIPFGMSTNRTEIYGDGADYAKLTITGGNGSSVSLSVDYGLFDLDPTDATKPVATDNVATVTIGATGETAIYLVAPKGLGDGTVLAKSGSGDFKLQQFTYIPGTAKTITLSPTPATVAPGGMTSLEATVVDVTGNPVVEGTLVTFTQTVNGSRGALTNLSASTDALGVARASYVAGVAAGTDTFAAKTANGTVSLAANLTVSSTAVIIGNVALSADKTELVADGSSTSYLTATVLDTDGLPAVGQQVTFTPTLGTIITADADSGVAGVQVVTDASGVAKATYKAGIIAGADSVTANCDGMKATVGITLNPGKAAKLEVSFDNLTYPPAAALSLESGKQTLFYAKVTDINGNAVRGETVNFSMSLAADHPSQGWFTCGLGAPQDVCSQYSVTGVTGGYGSGDGIIEAIYTAGPNSLVTDTITVTLGELTQSFTQKLKIDVKAQPKWSIKLYYDDLSTAVPVLPATILTGSGASTAIFAQVLDGVGNPVAGAMVTFGFNVGKNLSGATVNPATFVTDVNGFATATYKAGTLSGINDELTVLAGTETAVAIFQVDPVVSTIDFDKTELIVGATSTESLRFTLKNQLGQPMAGTAFQITPGGSVNPSTTSALTGLDGTYLLNVDDAAQENSTITVSAGGLSKTIPVYAGATLELTPASANAPADGVTNLTYTVNLRDYAGVVLSGIQVRFSGLNKVILSTGLATTDASGNASVNVRSTIFTPTDGTKEITVEAGALTATADAVFEPGPAKDIVLSVPALANPLSLGGDTTITAVITDALGNPVKTGTVINFALDGSIGSVTGQAVTADATGTVAAPFQAGMKSGNVTITATSGAATSTINLTIQPSAAGIIELSAVEPTTKMINIRGSGMTQSATIYFIVKDGAGNSVADGTVVNFSLPIASAASVANGGEAIATTTLFAEAVIGTTVNGIASVTLRSGKLARTVGVQAMVITSYTDTNANGTYDAGDLITGTISTEARVTIVGGQPDSRHISIATERYNTAGGITFGLQNSITALLGDRFSNIPIDGTPVSFYSECGTIGNSTGFVLSSIGGQVVANMTTQNPTTPNLAGVGGSGNVGMCTVLAAMPGEEYYDDFNGDGVYTAGVDSCSGDQGEPYIDGNDSGAYELGEFFVDNNNNGSWNGPDGVCSSSTMIWDDITVMMSSYPAALNVTPVYFTIPIGGFQEFNLNLTDIFGNAPVAGTSLKISADGGTLGGTIDYTVPDYAGVGNWYSEDSNGNGVLDANDRGVDIDGDGIPDPGVPVRFWLSADTKADAAAKAVKITITRNPAPASPAGTDGIVEKITISGTINTPASWSRMSVSSNAYSLSAGTGTANVTATLTDAIGWPVQGATVNFNTNPAGALQYGAFAPVSGVTDANGQVSTTFTAGQLVGFVDLVASAAGGDYVGSTSIRVIPSAATKVTLSLSDPVITAGGLVAANALVQDAYDNPVADQTVTFSTLINNSVGSLSAGSATTNSFGIASVNYTAGSDLASGTETDTLRASVGAINGDAALIVTTPAAAAKSLQLNLTTSSMVANGTATTTATAYVSDSADSKVPGQPVQGVEVLFSTTLGTIPVSAFTNASGVATATLTAAAVPGSGTVQASVGVLSATADFTLVPGPAATLTNILAFPATVKPSGNSTISVRVVDATGNAVADGTFVSFAVTTNNSGGYLLATSATTVSGNASVVYKAGNTSLIDTITISSNPAASLPVNVTVNSGLSSIDAMTITTSSEILRNNGTDAALITATVTKAGVPVDGIDVSFANAGVAGTLFTTGGVPYAGAIFTDSNGEAQVVFKAGVVQGTATVTATFGATNATAVLTIIDKVANVVVTSDDATIVADGAMTTDVTATVTDMVGVPLSGITLNLNTTRGTLSAGPYITNASGQVTATLTSMAITGTALVTANYGTITDTEPVQFVVGPPTTVTMTGSPTTLPYGAQTSLAVQVLDSQLRPVPNANLYFGFSPSAVLGNLSGGSYSLTSGTTDAQGRLTVLYTSGSVTASDTLLVETEESGVDATLTINVNPATAEIGNMILAAPTFPSIVANGVTATQLTATVTDSFGAPMNGVPVSFASTFGAIDTDGTPLTKTVPTSTLGTATVTLTSTTTIGTAYVTAVTGGFQEQQRIDFIPGNPVWKKADNVTIVSTLTPVNGSLAADGSSTTEVTAVLKDINGNLVADGTNVTLLSTMGSVVTNPLTTSNGVATFTVKAPKTTGTADLSISTIPGLTAAIQFGVNSGANIGALTLNAVASNITVSGAGQPSSTTITIQAVESDGTPIDEAFWGANNTVRLTLISHPGGGEFVAGTGGVCSNAALLTEDTCVAPNTWDAGQYVTTSTSFIDVRTSNGTATVTLQAGTLPGVIEIMATALDETGALTSVTASLPNITVAAGPVHNIVLIPGPSVVNAANSSLFGRIGTIIATDRFGNAVPDGTELNLGLVDTIISADTAGTAITTASTNTLTGAFVNTLVRAVQPNDRVLIPTADAVDRNRFIASGTVSPFTVTQNYNVTGSWNAYIGAATQGGYVSGGSGEIGRTTTTNGIAALNVSYPAALTITAPARGYGCGVIPVLNVSEGVFVVVTSNVGGVTTVNQGGFCFAP